MARPWLVTGSSGQVGSAFVRLAGQAKVAVSAPPREALDLSDPRRVRGFAGSEDWAGVVNCAAYTAVDRAESEPELAEAINAAAPAALAEMCAERGIPLLHVSTDYVFDGSGDGPYREDDPTAPLGVYGRTKLAGEEAIRQSGARHAIVRTAWVVSSGPRNFIDTMLRLASERDEVRVVADQQGSPTSAEDLAAALLSIAGQLGERSGTWHFANAGAATWHDLAARVFGALERRGMKRPRLVPITTAEYPTPARRPANSRLDTAKIATDFGIVPRRWEKSVDAILAERLGRCDRLVAPGELHSPA